MSRSFGVALVAAALMAPTTLPAYGSPTPIRGQLVDRVPIGGAPITATFLRTRPEIVVLDAKGRVVFVDARSFEQVGTTQHLAAGLFDAVVTDDERFVYAWSTQSRELYVVSVERRQLDRTIELPGGVQDVALLPDGETLVASSPRNRTLSWIRRRDDQRLGRMEMPFPPGRLRTLPQLGLLLFGGGIDAKGGRAAPVGPNLFFLPVLGPAWESSPVPVRATAHGRHAAGLRGTADQRVTAFVGRGFGVTIQRHARGHAVTADGRWLLTTHPSTPVVSVTEVATGFMDLAVSVPPGPGPIIQTSAEQFLVLHQSDSFVSVLRADHQKPPSLTTSWPVSGPPIDAVPIGDGGHLALAIPGQSVPVRTARYVQTRFRRSPLRLGITFRVGGPGPQQDTVSIFHPDQGEVASWRVAPGPTSVRSSPSGDMLAVTCAIDGSVVFLR